MTKRRWILLLLPVLLLAGYVKLFYKTWSNDTVPANADCVVALDVKRIRNTILWEFISTPALWKKGSLFPTRSKDELRWDELVTIPDYIFIFHVAGQSSNAWYTVFGISNNTNLDNGLAQMKAEKNGEGTYWLPGPGMSCVRYKDQLLVSTLPAGESLLLRSVATSLFEKKNFIQEAVLKKNVATATHLSAQIRETTWLAGNLVTASFDKKAFTIHTLLSFPNGVQWPEAGFVINDSSMCSLAFTQPGNFNKLFPGSTRAEISRAVNFNIDSLLLSSNQQYQLEVEGIHAHVDSAISYTYDDDFNPVEKVVLNTINEPAFIFSVTGTGTDSVFRYWKAAGKLTPTAEGELFTPVPFAKSYCSNPANGTIMISTPGYRTVGAGVGFTGIFFARVLFTKVPGWLQHYLPQPLLQQLQNLRSVTATITLTGEKKTALEIRFDKKKEADFLFNW